jgi:chemotaxis protein MotB
VNVVKYFTEVGNIDPRRLSAVGYGESRPLVANDTPANRQKNRRVEILLLTEDKEENVK